MTQLTDAGSGVFICRNLMDGCARDGKLLIFDQLLSGMAMDLPGADNYIVLTNTTAMEVQVRIKVLVP